jgi:hypothetical protein
MISFERALNSIREKSLEEVREFVRNRILGVDIASFGSGHSTEPSEDVVIQLLRNPELDTDKRKAVVDGWIDVYRQVRAWLDDPDYVEETNKWEDVVVNLCRVVDISEPPEFKKYVKRLITELLDEESSPGELLRAAVKAYMAYAQDEKSVRFWEDEILTNKDVAAYGFNALLDIDPNYERIEEKLCELWRLQVGKNWPVNTAFLLRRAARLRNETALIYRVLLKLKNVDYSLWEKIEKELKQPWSQQWLEKLKEFESPIRRRTHKEERESLIKGKHETEPNLEVWLEDEGIGFDKKYYLKMGMRMHPIDIGYYLDFLNNFLKSQKIRDKVKVIDSQEIYEETEYA